ncbi:hypothetical protein FBZ90_101160 [Nitrospirillum pindoramense]|uniref:HEPN AbiU2-like domain-containing protein n=2 Tax=Nitrospirillum amazonense TaxID=28077 RepID=A0A560HHB5_9PROT|nr:hypothetical protein FBZ90_101160 [Nitrospirillum amazonense]
MCVSARATFLHFEILFPPDAGSRRALLARVAPIFFDDLNLLLLHAIVLHVCRLTDPQGKGNRVNLTVEYLSKNADFGTDTATAARVAVLESSMSAFRSKIEPARNKFISHVDRAAVHDGKNLGAATDGEWRQFWNDLEEFLQHLSRRYIDPDDHFRLGEIHGMTDADQLVKALWESLALKEIMADPRIGDTAVQMVLDSPWRNT